MDQQEAATHQAEGGVALEDATNPMFQLLEQEDARSVPERGDIVEGTIVSISSSEIIIDIGCKSEGIVTGRDLERLEPEYRDSLRVGDSVLAYVVRPEDAQGNAVLSLSRAQLERDWKAAEELFEAGKILEQPVMDCNKGGLIVNVGRVRGFIPASQVVSVQLPRGSSEEERIEQLQQLVGTPLRLKIIEMERRRNRLILSERVAMREWRQREKERLLDELQPGETKTGTVSSLCNFGAFVDLGGADGLVHLSELSWRHVNHPGEALEVGQEVDVYVLSVDRDRRRIALSIKRLQPEPWSTVEDRYEIGQLVQATVTKITEFGAFARLSGEDIEGLIHISELSDDRVAHPRDVVTEGQEISVRIIRIDADRQRLGLSLRRVNDEQYFDFDWQDEDLTVEPSSSTEGEDTE